MPAIIRTNFFYSLLLIFCTTAFVVPVHSSAQTLTQHQKDSLLNNWQSIPGSTIQIIPPAYFKPFEKDGKYGFLHEGAGASIYAQEIPNTPYLVAVQAFTKEYIESQGLKFISREDVKTKNGSSAVIIAVGFSIKGGEGKQDVEYERLMLFTGDYAKTIWVQGNYPVIARKVLYNVIRESLLSVQF